MDAMRLDEQKIFATTKEDLRQVTADVPVVMQRQVPVIQRVQRTVDVALVQYIDGIVDVPLVKRRQALPIQTVQKTLEVPPIQRRWSSRRRRQSRCPTADRRQGGLMQKQVPQSKCAEKQSRCFTFSSATQWWIPVRTNATSEVLEQDC